MFFEFCGNFAILVLIRNSHLKRVFESITVLAQNKAFYRFILKYVFYLQFVKFKTLSKVKRPFITLYNEVTPEV